MIFQKRGGKGGASIRISVGVMITWKITNLTSETAIRASYHAIFDRNQHSGILPSLSYPLFMPPLCTRFHVQLSRAKKVKFLRFLSEFLKFTSTHRPLPPLFIYSESSRSPLQIMYLSFFHKMRCLGCTDPVPKNELVVLLCLGLITMS